MRLVIKGDGKPWLDTGSEGKPAVNQITNSCPHQAFIAGAAGTIVCGACGSIWDKKHPDYHKHIRLVR